MGTEYDGPRTVPPRHVGGEDRSVTAKAKEFRYAIGLDHTGWRINGRDL
jgi:hypothetical protein